MANPLDDLSPEVRAKFEELLAKLGPKRAPGTNQGLKQRKRIRHTIPDSWEDYVPKRLTWRAEMRRKVMRTSLELLHEVGPRKFTVKEVARRAGVARSTIYKYFGMKAELLTFCLDGFWACGPTAAEQATERIAHQVIIDALQQHGQDGPAVADVVSDVAIALTRSRERNLWLLTAAERTRAGRLPWRSRIETAPCPLRRELHYCLQALLDTELHVRSGDTKIMSNQAQGVSAADEQPDSDVIPTLLHAIAALIWYETALNGAAGEESPPELQTIPELAGLDNEPRVRKQSAADRHRYATTIKQAVRWLLQGAGLADCRLAPLAVEPSGLLDEDTRYSHPTGQLLNKIQFWARLNAPGWHWPPAPVST